VVALTHDAVDQFSSAFAATACVFDPDVPRQADYPSNRVDSNLPSVGFGRP